MKNVVFVVGPALGHIGRSSLVARAVAREGHNVLLVGPGRHGYEGVIDAPFVALPSDTADPVERSARFADALEAQLEETRADAVCLDLSPVPWLVATRFPPVPLVYFTNWFLTRAARGDTVQDKRMAQHRRAWDMLRSERGLAPLRDARELYERDRVFLLDPLPLVPEDLPLPDTHRVVGACCWEPARELPEPIAALDDVLLLSLGSTSSPHMPEGLFAELARAAGASAVVEIRADARFERVSATHWRAGMIPLSGVLQRARLVLTHGGSGSVYQALLHGVPIVCWPGHQNHSILVKRLEELGVGLLLRPSGWEDQVRGVASRLDTMRTTVRSLFAENAAGAGCPAGPEAAAAEVLRLITA